MRQDVTATPLVTPPPPLARAAGAPVPATLESIARLRQIVWELETDSGLAALGEHERDVLYAIWAMGEAEAEGGRTFLSNDLRQREIVRAMAPATFYRALNALRRRGFIRFAPGSRRNRYLVCTPPRIGADGASAQRLQTAR